MALTIHQRLLAHHPKPKQLLLRLKSKLLELKFGFARFHELRQ